MVLSDILVPEAVVPCMRASSKKRLLQELSIIIANIYHLEQLELLSALQDRESLGPTGMGHGVAIPHAKINSIESVHGLFARLIKPLDFGAMDSQSVDLVFVLIAPYESGANHLKALAKVSRLLRNRSTCEKLRSTIDKSALFSILTTETEIQAA
ncbi:MAG: PTS sugar transporter subunit IIA [Paracoccaceae bacterium]|nr:PTS sugar transporter subunit IIA [Paracoccaceae bacterium]